MDHRIAYELSAMKVVHHYLYPLLSFLSQENFGRMILEHWDEIQLDQAVITVGKIVMILSKRQIVGQALSSYQKIAHS